MNEIRRPIREAEETLAVRAIVERHVLPEFVTGFRVRLGDFNDDPALWVTFLLREDLPPGHPDVAAWVSAIDASIDEVRDDLIENYPRRYPLFDLATA